MSILQLHGPHEVKGRFPFTNPSGVDRIEKGDAILVNDDNLLGIAITGCGIAGTAPSTADGEPHGDVCMLATRGDFVADLEGGSSFTYGDPVWLDIVTGEAFDTAGAGRHPRAVATETTTGASTTVNIILNGLNDGEDLV